jgi:hypothetical protein
VGFSVISIFIGIVVGLVMSLTGSGGALVSIPLFIEFKQLSLKEASVLSLLAVIFSSVVSFIFQKIKLNYKLCFGVFLFSALGSFVALPLKSVTSDELIALLLTSIAAFSLFRTWFPLKRNTIHFQNPKFWPIAVLGLSLGILTTLTGIGGGIVLVPILSSFFSQDHEEAIGSSLVIVGLSSFFSFLIQISSNNLKIPPVELLYLGIGILLMNIAVRMVLIKLITSKIVLLRKFVFTFVVLFTVLKLF